MTNSTISLPLLVPPPTSPSLHEAQVQLLVTTLTGEQVAELTLPPGEKIIALKRKVKAASSIPERQQQLLWEASLLEDDCTLADVCLPLRGAVLQLIVRDPCEVAQELEEMKANALK